MSFERGLMMKFNDVVPTLAKGMAGGSTTSSAAIGNVANSSIQDFKSALSGVKNFAGKIATGKSQLERESGRRQGLLRAKLAVTESGTAKAIKESKLGKLGSVIYHSSGFVKDMILPPGSMMIGSPEEIAKRKADLEKAKEANRAADAKAYAKEGYAYEYNKSYRERIGEFFDEKTGSTAMRRRANEFDNTYYKNGEFNFKAAGLGVAKRAGQIAYNTKLGKAVYDETVKLKNAVVEEYKATFTEQGRIDRINSSKIDNRISALATQYQHENPLRDRDDRNKDATISKWSDTLNIDRNELMLMDQIGQQNYIDRAYAALPEYKRNSATAKIYADMKENIATNGALTRTARDMDPNTLAKESYAALGLDRRKIEALSNKEQLAALEKGLRSAGLEGKEGEESYRAYAYLKQKAQANGEMEKSVAEVKKRSFYERAGQMMEDIANAPRKLYDAIPGRGTVVAHLEGDKSGIRAAQIYAHADRFEKDPQARVQINGDNADQVLKEACFALGVNEATIQSIAPERRLEYIENALNSTIHLDPTQDFEAYRRPLHQL